MEPNVAKSESKPTKFDQENLFPQKRDRRHAEYSPRKELKEKGG
jgi:hypothetical protein